MKIEIEEARFILCQKVKQKKIERENKNLLGDINNKTFQTEVKLENLTSKKNLTKISQEMNRNNVTKNKIKLEMKSIQIKPLYRVKPDDVSI